MTGLTYYCGTSEACEAELGVCAEAAFTMIEMVNNEVTQWFGFATKAEMAAEAKQAKEAGASIAWL